MNDDAKRDDKNCPATLYVWIVPSEQVLDQPGSWRIRKWDMEPFPEATHVCAARSAEREVSSQEVATALKYLEFFANERRKLGERVPSIADLEDWANLIRALDQRPPRSPVVAGTAKTASEREASKLADDLAAMLNRNETPSPTQYAWNVILGALRAHRPAAPSSEGTRTIETPRVDVALNELADDQRGAVHYNGSTFIDLARQLERELAEAETASLRWYMAASPYATPEALHEALASRSAIGPSKEFAARVRPAVAAWVRKCDRSVLNPTLPKHYGPMLQAEADRAHALLEEIDAMIDEKPDCSHYWIPNSGKGGEPIFRLNSQMGPKPVMHVMCSLCDTRTWFTEEQWQAIPAGPEPKPMDSTTTKEKP